ncbi:MAG: ribosome biogenesis GTP-binding protein YihA/YsxC [Alphaproteobacteria bacterium]|nr:ribosome biogenesis GTP-binding protein YihA/YsxC [Alphaproteobacteria bacterium]
MAVLEGDTSQASSKIGRHLFAQECTFVRGVATLPDLPEPSLPEIAFAGRSNVGKSSLLNGLTGRKTLARTSNTPGRTRELNFFDLAGRLMLVDLPGYGYARASKTEISRWNKTLRDYLRGRPNLQRLCLLIDARHGLKAGDEEMMKMLDASAVVYRVVLTKVDKLSAAELETTSARVAAVLKTHPAALPELITTSSRKGLGISELQTDLATLANPQ